METEHIPSVFHLGLFLVSQNTCCYYFFPNCLQQLWLIQVFNIYCGSDVLSSLEKGELSRRRAHLSAVEKRIMVLAAQTAHRGGCGLCQI